MPDRSPISSTTKVNPHLVGQIHQIFEKEPNALATIDYIAAYTKNLKETHIHQKQSDNSSRKIRSCPDTVEIIMENSGIISLLQLHLYT
jgi:hypothetical protein